MQATEPTWTDQRMDEFAERNEKNFDEVRVEIRDARNDLRAEINQSRNELRAEIRHVETGLKGEVKMLRAEMNTRLNAIDRKFDILFGAMASGLAAAVVQHFIG